MAFTITNTLKEQLPPLRFIGKRYTFADTPFGAKWDEFFQSGDGATLDALGAKEGIENGYIGLERYTLTNGKAENFEYWIGGMFDAGKDVPDGFGFVDLPESDVGVVWVYGNADDGSIYGAKTSMAAYEKVSTELNGSPRVIDGFNVSFERYNCPRFTGKDENGNVTLDYGIYIN